MGRDFDTGDNLGQVNIVFYVFSVFAAFSLRFSSLFAFSSTARLFDYFDSGVMEGLQHRLLQLAKSRTQGRLAETPGNSMALTSQVRRIEVDSLWRFIDQIIFQFK